MASMTTEQWATGLIDAMKKAGYKVEATPNNIQNIQRMIGFETSGNQAGFMRDNNPWNLNTYTGAHGSLPGGKIVNEFGIHVQTFDSVEAGYAAYVSQFKSNPSLLTAFEKNASPADFGTALSQSGWSSGHYANATTFATGAPFNGSSEASSGALNNQPNPGAGLGNAAQLATSSSSGMTAAETREIDTPYTGPGAYKGFDLQGVLPGQMQLTKNAIDTVLAQPGGVKGMLDAIYKNFGTEAWMANVPEVRTLLVAGSQLGYDSNKALFDSAFQNTNWYKSTAPGQRNFDELQANDPASAAGAVQKAAARVTNLANQQGVQLTHAEVQSLAKTVASQSISSEAGIDPYQESLVNDSKILGYIGQMAQTPDFITGLTGSQAAATSGITGSTAPATAPPTGAMPGGDAAYLYDQFTTIAKNNMLNWTPQQVAAAVQKALLGDTGQSNFLAGAVSGFNVTAQNNAKNLYPAFASAIGTDTATNNDQNMFQATQSYRNIVAQYTGNADPNSINLNDPQWSWILSGGPAPTAANASVNNAQNTPGSTKTGSSSSAVQGTGAPPTIDALQTYLMGTPQFQSTDAAKQMAWHVGSAITSAFGF
jgi:hypothetical protein